MRRILIADDQQVIRTLIRGLLEAEKIWKVCAEASDGKQAIKLCESLSPDLAILDIHMPNMNGFDAIRFISSHWPRISLLALSTDESVHFALAAEACGAHGFLSKALVTNFLPAAVDALLRDKRYLPDASPNRDCSFAGQS